MQLFFFRCFFAFSLTPNALIVCVAGMFVKCFSFHCIDDGNFFFSRSFITNILFSFIFRYNSVPCAPTSFHLATYSLAMIIGLPISSRYYLLLGKFLFNFLFFSSKTTFATTTTTAVTNKVALLRKEKT